MPNTSLRTSLILAPIMLAASGTAAADGFDISIGALITGILSTIIYSLVGIAIAILGFKIMDWLTPGDLRELIIEQENLPIAIVTAAGILGICIIIAAVLNS